MDYNLATTTTALTGSPQTVVSSDTLPAISSGTNYLVWGSVEIDASATDAGSAWVTCQLNFDGNSDADSVKFNPPSGGAFQTGNIYLSIPGTITSSAQATISCELNNSNAAQVDRAVIDVIQFTTGLGG